MDVDRKWCEQQRGELIAAFKFYETQPQNSRSCGEALEKLKAKHRDIIRKLPAESPLKGDLPVGSIDDPKKSEWRFRVENLAEELERLENLKPLD